MQASRLSFADSTISLKHGRGQMQDGEFHRLSNLRNWETKGATIAGIGRKGPGSRDPRSTGGKKGGSPCGSGSHKKVLKMEPWQMETWTKTCGPYPGALILTHTLI